jgi:hypothetical protein
MRVTKDVRLMSPWQTSEPVTIDETVGRNYIASQLYNLSNEPSRKWTVVCLLCSLSSTDQPSTQKPYGTKEKAKKIHPSGKTQGAT